MDHHASLKFGSWLERGYEVDKVKHCFHRLGQFLLIWGVRLVCERVCHAARGRKDFAHFSPTRFSRVGRLPFFITRLPLFYYQSLLAPSLPLPMYAPAITMYICTFSDAPPLSHSSVHGPMYALIVYQRNIFSLQITLCSDTRLLFMIPT